MCMTFFFIKLIKSNHKVNLFEHTCWCIFVFFLSSGCLNIFIKYIYLILLLFCIVFFPESVYLHEKHAVTNLVSGPKLVVRSFRALVRRIRTDNRMSERPQYSDTRPDYPGFTSPNLELSEPFGRSGTLVSIRVSKNIILHDE